uniref:Uncharacterized protein n=1 Tax=Arundo donax TaxID=35708 RepID=A0A0A9CDB2_ARUDO
MPPSGPHFAP